MLSKIIKYINTLVNSVDTFNKHINNYKAISKEPALPSYAYINWGMHLIYSGQKEKGLEKLLIWDYLFFMTNLLSFQQQQPTTATFKENNVQNLTIRS